jgi:hypothetical protein
MLSLSLLLQKTSHLVPKRNRAIASLVVGSKLVVFIGYYHGYRAGVEYALRSAEINKMSPCQPVPVIFPDMLPTMSCIPTN